MPLPIIMRPWAALILVGCASGQQAVVPMDGDVTEPVDGSGSQEIPPDAAKIPIDAKPIDAPPPPADAPPVTPPADAPPCQVMTRQLLLNPVFDLTPIGTNWTQVNIDNAAPIITSDGQLAAQSAPYKAWMGGLAGIDKGVSSLTDQLYQDVAIPANTTMLKLTGYYVVGTTETTTANVYDTAQLGLVQTNGTPIETALSLNNLTVTGATWTAINKTFTTNLSGQTVRLRATSTNDITNHSNFFFDSLALTATYCQ